MPGGGSRKKRGKSAAAEAQIALDIAIGGGYNKGRES